MKLFSKKVFDMTSSKKNKEAGAEALQKNISNMP
jgi:hypothetical protein